VALEIASFPSGRESVARAATWKGFTRIRQGSDDFAEGHGLWRAAVSRIICPAVTFHFDFLFRCRAPDSKLAPAGVSIGGMPHPEEECAVIPRRRNAVMFARSDQAVRSCQCDFYGRAFFLALRQSFQRMPSLRACHQWATDILRTLAISALHRRGPIPSWPDYQSRAFFGRRANFLRRNCPASAKPRWIAKLARRTQPRQNTRHISVIEHRQRLFIRDAKDRG